MSPSSSFPSPEECHPKTPVSKPQCSFPLLLSVFEHPSSCQHHQLHFQHTFCRCSKVRRSKRQAKEQKPNPAQPTMGPRLPLRRHQDCFKESGDRSFSDNLLIKSCGLRPATPSSSVSLPLWKLQVQQESCLFLSKIWPKCTSEHPSREPHLHRCWCASCGLLSLLSHPLCTSHKPGAQTQCWIRRNWWQQGWGNRQQF